MPTGYTYKVGEGISFEEFIWSCARGFGALIHMRDDPSNAPIDLNPTEADFYQKNIRSAENRLRRLQKMNPHQIEEAAVADSLRKMRSWARQLRKNKALGKKYRAMLARIQQWDPPTKDHEQLKSFMIQQLEQSIAHDLYRNGVPNVEKPLVWHRQQIKLARKNIEYYSKARKEEQKRVTNRADWLNALNSSVPCPNKK